MQLDLDGKKMIEGESNFSFCTRPDGSVLAVCRGGGIWLSEDGLKPFVRKSEGRVYPDVAGRFEDPVLWRDEVQYHIIVNDWLGRVAWKLVSPDGFSWTTLPGEAYTPGIARVKLQFQSQDGKDNSQLPTHNSQLPNYFRLYPFWVSQAMALRSPRAARARIFQTVPFSWFFSSPPAPMS